MAGSDPKSTPLPSGTERISRWASRNGLTWQAIPDQGWFQAWEPYDTMVSPSRYLNAVTKTYRRGALTFVEPWLADEGFEPIDRTLLAFASHPRLLRKVSVRVGESFLTRVAFIESPPPPRVKLGDPAWDDWASTFAINAQDAAAALHPSLRKLLMSWKFAGHLELRAGGLVVQVAGLGPTPESLDRLMQFLPGLVDSALEAY
ncbi:MAG: hypothetical protein HY898_08315 [Deltaproteobacteria bacterium]|nr:hypothetical protein [Deltaproteobacteria bacterium]